MNRTLLISLIALTVTFEVASGHSHKRSIISTSEYFSASTREAELDRFWKEVSRTVSEGDFEGYKATYHEDAVVVFTTSENKASKSISTALADWKHDFTDVKTGKRKNSVEFKFSQRIGSETSAHETGIFHYTSVDSCGKSVADAYILFEALLVKRDGRWLLVMEYQKSKSTKKEWEAF